jgi:O-antigen/teichoic acid export membrane protein
MFKFLKNDVRTFIVVLTIIFSFALLFMLFFVNIPAQNKDLINILIVSIIINGMSSIRTYFFNNQLNQDTK